MKMIAVLVLTLCLVGLGNSYSEKVKVKVENSVVRFDASPRDVNGITMVPIRNMVDAMGGTMRWDLGAKTLSVWQNSRRFDIVLNSRTARVNDQSMTMDEAPSIYKNRIYVPLKFVADASGYLISMENGWYVLRPTRKRS